MLLLNFIRALIVTFGCLIVYAIGTWTNPAVSFVALPFALGVAFTLGDIAENFIIKKFNSET